MDLIQAYKIIGGHDDVEHTLWFKIFLSITTIQPHMTGGLTLEIPASWLDNRRNFFSLRVV